MATGNPNTRNEADSTAEAAAKVESDIREFVRRDQFAPRRLREPRREQERDAPGIPLPTASQLDTTPPHTAQEIADLIRRVSGGSMDEIDRVIRELQSVRDMLRQEGERVSREMSGYASLNAAAMTAMKIIAESMAQWKMAPGARDNGK